MPQDHRGCWLLSCLQNVVCANNDFARADGYVNIIPTDVLGLTLSYTPQQVLHIVTFGAPGAKGGFFPQVWHVDSCSLHTVHPMLVVWLTYVPSAM